MSWTRRRAAAATRLTTAVDPAWLAAGYSPVLVNQGGRLLAVGTLSGTLTDAAGTVIGTVTNAPVSVPAAAAAGTCTILDLTPGPLDVNLLGLMVHLNQAHLLITAYQGPGNLLGNLLCAVANLLNGGGPLGSLVGLLNNILRNL